MEGYNNVSFYELMKKYEVKSNSLEEFFNNYFFKEGRDSLYIKASFEDLKKDLEKKGYCVITSFDSVSNEAVAFYQ